MNPWLSTQAEVIREAARRHRIRTVRVFGSMARDDANADSDVDLLVELDQGAGLLDQVEFKDELEQRWSRKVDVVTPAALHWYIRDQVIREAQPL
ncbi:MAG: nucleotidyltransferase family protein [Chromatiaceae bacterium]